MAKLLTNMGCPCTHETIFTHQGLEYARETLQKDVLPPMSEVSLRSGCWLFSSDKENIKAESSYMAAPFLDHMTLADVSVIHVVRNPIDVINSFVVDANYFRSVPPKDNYQVYIYRHLPQLGNMPNPKKDKPGYGAVDRAMRYYLDWNDMIQRKTQTSRYLQHQIENEDTQEIMDFVGGSKTDYCIDRKTNSWRTRKPRLEWGDLPEGRIKRQLTAMATAYGYKLPGEIMMI
jgi:hypothetical protein